MLNSTTACSLDNYFQLAMSQVQTWDLVQQVSREMGQKSKEVTSFTFQCLQGCSEEIKIQLLQRVITGDISVERLKTEADHVKAVVKVGPL